ncbi:hypothetical protein MMC29_006737 [Sticta canariensis]|nr:hypothetical protein [Sticta canariensis]
MPITSRWTIDIPEISLVSLLLTSPAHPLSDDPIFLDAGCPAAKYLTRDSHRLWSQRFAAGLRRSGLQDGDRVLLFSANSVFFPVVFMGVIMAGGIFTGSNPLSVASELAYQLKDSDASFLLCATANLNTGLEAASQAGLPKGQIFVFDDVPITGEIGQPSLGCDHWSNLLSSEAEGKAFQWKDLSRPNECHQTIALNYSSGTTGLPKGVEITHYNYVAHTLQMQHMDSLLADSMVRKAVDRWLCFLPMYHAMAQAIFISLALRRGIPVYIMPNFNFIKMLEYVQDFRITRLMVVPSVLVMIAKDSRTRRGDWDLSSVVEIGCGAAPLAGDLIEELKTEWLWNDDPIDERGKVAVTQGYGMTELTACAIMTGPPEASLQPTTNDSIQFTEFSPFSTVISANDASSVGELVANCSAKIMNEDASAEVGHGERGELWIRGPTVMKGYWRNEVATKTTVTEDGWLMTGDICTMSNSSNFRIVDRKKELIKIRGHQVAPAELEALLLRHPSIQDAAVIGVLINSEEHPRAYIVPQLGDLIDTDEVLEFVKQRASRFKWITGGVIILGAIPRNMSGKILRRVLREMEAEKKNSVGIEHALRPKL